MTDSTKLTVVKTIHTAVWLVMASATVYILYAGITNTFSTWLWVAIGLLLFESTILLANRWTCPLTPVAMKYTADRNDNFDIYLPRLAAKYNKAIFGTLFVVGLILVISNIVRAL